MIYIIDDKRSRQRDYGWDENKFAMFPDAIVPIWNMDGLRENCSSIIQSGNVVLFHESFFSSEDEELCLFKQKIKNNSSLYVAYFSGSKSGRYVENDKCMLPPDVLYLNLEVFTRKHKEGETNFKYLAFGDNYSVEYGIRHELEQVNKKNVGVPRINTDKKLFFAVTSADAVEPPFNIEPVRDWDYFDSDVSDKDLDLFVREQFRESTYDAIYIPLYIGNVYSDFLGLRLAMHIRLTSSVNSTTPVFIYGVSSYEDLRQNACFDVLKFSTVLLIGSDSDSFSLSLNKIERTDNYDFALQNIHLNIPCNIGNNHSVANKWAVYRWSNMLKLDNEILLEDDVRVSLYFKYIDAKFGQHDKFKEDQKYSVQIEGIEGKTIVYIDDEYNKGWKDILSQIFKASKAKCILFTDFDKKIAREKLLERIYRFIDENDADCYLLDLRLHENDFAIDQRKELSGHCISKYIKNKNIGNQVVIFTASNKIWNLKEEIFKNGAMGYALKESPDLNLKRKDSLELYKDFVNSIKSACNMSYLKDMVTKQGELESLCSATKQLESVVNLLAKDNGENDKDLLGAALLAEIVFVEDFIKSQGYSLLSTGKDDTLKVELCKNTGEQIPISGFMFFKREQNGNYSNVIDVSDFYKAPQEPPSGWCKVSNSDVTLVAATLLKECSFSANITRKYVHFKHIRNTQVAHKITRDTKIAPPNSSERIEFSETDIKDFYDSLIYPLVKKLCTRT